MRATLATDLLALSIVLVLAVPSGATSIADYSSALDWTSLSATAGGSSISWLSPGSYAHFHADNDLGGAGWTTAIDNFNFASPWGPTSASDAIVNGSGGAFVGDELLAFARAKADFTTTAWVEVGTIAQRTGTFSVASNPGAVSIDLDFEFAGYATTDLPGDHVSLLNCHVAVWADMMYSYLDAAGNRKTDWVGLGPGGTHREPLSTVNDLNDGADATFPRAGTLSLSFDPAAHLPAGGFDPKVLVTFEARAYAFVEATQPGGPPPIPEPATLLLFAAGLGTLAAIRTRRRRARP